MWKVIFLIVSSFSMLCVWMALAASQQNINFSFYKILIFHCCFSANMKVYRRRQPTLRARPSAIVGRAETHIRLILVWLTCGDDASQQRDCFMEAANYFRHFLIYTKSLPAHDFFSIIAATGHSLNLNCSCWNNFLSDLVSLRYLAWRPEVTRQNETNFPCWPRRCWLHFSITRKLEMAKHTKKLSAVENER